MVSRGIASSALSSIALPLYAFLLVLTGCSEPENGCFIGESFYENGASYITDGCNEASCTAGESWGTYVGCDSCEDLGSRSSCESSVLGCAWFEECDSKPAGCRSARPCEVGTECGVYGSRAQGTCIERFPDDCTTPTPICEAPACWKAQRNPAGACVGPADVPYEEECCDMEYLCTTSGGSWHEESCGHYVCGKAPSCHESIPGCDCGPARTYAEGLGCLQAVHC